MSEDKSKPAEVKKTPIFYGGEVVLGPQISFAVERLSKTNPGDVQEVVASQIQLLSSLALV